MLRASSTRPVATPSQTTRPDALQQQRQSMSSIESNEVASFSLTGSGPSTRQNLQRSSSITTGIQGHKRVLVARDLTSRGGVRPTNNNNNALFTPTSSPGKGMTMTTSVPNVKLREREKVAPITSLTTPRGGNIATIDSPDASKVKSPEAQDPSPAMMVGQDDIGAVAALDQERTRMLRHTKKSDITDVSDYCPLGGLGVDELISPSVDPTTTGMDPTQLLQLLRDRRRSVRHATGGSPVPDASTPQPSVAMVPPSQIITPRTADIPRPSAPGSGARSNTAAKLHAATAAAGGASPSTAGATVPAPQLTNSSVAAAAASPMREFIPGSGPSTSSFIPASAQALLEHRPLSAAKQQQQAQSGIVADKDGRPVTRQKMPKYALDLFPTKIPASAPVNRRNGGTQNPLSRSIEDELFPPKPKAGSGSAAGPGRRKLRSGSTSPGKTQQQEQSPDFNCLFVNNDDEFGCELFPTRRTRPEDEIPLIESDWVEVALGDDDAEEVAANARASKPSIGVHRSEESSSDDDDTNHALFLDQNLSDGDDDPEAMAQAERHQLLLQQYNTNRASRPAKLLTRNLHQQLLHQTQQHQTLWSTVNTSQQQPPHDPALVPTLSSSSMKSTSSSGAGGSTKKEKKKSRSHVLTSYQQVVAQPSSSSSGPPEAGLRCDVVGLDGTSDSSSHAHQHPRLCDMLAGPVSCSGTTPKHNHKKTTPVELTTKVDHENNCVGSTNSNSNYTANTVALNSMKMPARKAWPSGNVVVSSSSVGGSSSPPGGAISMMGSTAALARQIGLRGGTQHRHPNIFR
eukprot:PhM_4_TR6353/c0_g1_i1/m.40269